MYHTLSDYQDQNRNYSNQNKFNSNYNNTNIKNGNLNSMKKGTMVNGSEVYYGKGKKIDPIKSGYKINKHYDIQRINKKITNNNINKIGYNKPVQYIYNEEKIKKIVINKKTEEFDENIVDLNKPSCYISIRLFNGDVVKTKFNCDKKLRDIYSFVKKIKNNKIIDFILLDGFPPKPLLDFDKSIKDLGIENSMLVQKTDKI